MTRVHDMGGRFGDGPVVPESQGEKLGVAEFGEEWHKAALSLTVASGAFGKWNIDMGRRARENLAPRDYNRFSYYEKWVAALADLLVETGIVTRDELANGQAAGTSDDIPMVTGEFMAAALVRGSSASRQSAVPPAFHVGQRVQTVRPAANRLVEGGHTRLPQYAAGATGRILLMHGAHVLPDSSAHALGDAPEPLYTVVFAASELWADPEDTQDQVTLDLWQSYLEAI